MTLKRITAATEQAVLLEEFKAHARIDSTDEDGDVQLKLDAAEEYIETDELGDRALITSTWDLYLDAWPCKPYIELPKGNLQSVAFIKYTVEDGTVVTWDATNYKLSGTYTVSNLGASIEGDGENDARVGRVWLRPNRSWPTATLDTGEPIVIRFTCGWEKASVVPAKIKAAIEMLAAHFYRNREAVTVGSTTAIESKPLALAVSSLCEKYVLKRF